MYPRLLWVVFLYIKFIFLPIKNIFLSSFHHLFLFFIFTSISRIYLSAKNGKEDQQAGVGIGCAAAEGVRGMWETVE